MHADNDLGLAACLFLVEPPEPFYRPVSRWCGDLQAWHRDSACRPPANQSGHDKHRSLESSRSDYHQGGRRQDAFAQELLCGFVWMLVQIIR
jgi:hypothetical protein